MPLFRDKSADRLYAHLLNLGVQVELLKEHPLKQVSTEKVTFGERLLEIIDFLEVSDTRKSLGLIQVSGRSIDYINVICEIKASGDLMSRPYYLEYLVLLEDIPSSSCRAVLETKKRGLFQREVVDIEWTGGILADKLNGDLTLKDNLLKEFQLNNRPLDITVAPEPAYRCARIETSERYLKSSPLRLSKLSEHIDRFVETGQSHPIFLPSRNLLDCIDRIAGITTEHVKVVKAAIGQEISEEELGGAVVGQRKAGGCVKRLLIAGGFVIYWVVIWVVMMEIGFEGELAFFMPGILLFTGFGLWKAITFLLKKMRNL